MKTISILIPTYNEENNVLPLYDALQEQLAALKERYNYEILFIDNKSQDSTREKIKLLCARDRHVKAIFNSRNFGAEKSGFYGAMQTTGDCTIGMHADFQTPPELLPRMIAAWEQGNKIVFAAKDAGSEASAAHFLRKLYYKSLRKLSNNEVVDHFTGFALYDRSVLEEGRKWDDAEPMIRTMASEVGFDRCIIPYTQQERRSGTGSGNFFSAYDLAMSGIVNYTKAGSRLATLFGALVSAASAVSALVWLILKLINWEKYPAGLALLAMGVFFFGGVQLMFLGLLGEYVINIQRRTMKRPLVVEECRLNFEDDAEEYQKAHPKARMR
ncbi:MAG: glycosyltransferase family 2 protein [Oscillospiraceae bacterium]|nr:glycosyltransferase family 2 protein [Oscillospiraceae bacterium]